MAELVSYITSWFTPASLFILMNLVIGTIAVISSLGGRQQQQQQHSTTHDESGSPPPPPPQQQISRNPSFFSRVTSFNYLSNNQSSSHSSFRSEPEYSQTNEYPSSTTEDDPAARNQEAPLSRAPSFLSRMASFKLSFRRETAVNDPGHEEHQQMERTTSELTEAAEAAEEAAGKMRKTASEKSRLKKKVVPAPEEIVRRSAESSTGTTRRVLRNRGRETSSFEEVDAKADDFINRFKQQLRLQRLDSLLRGRTTSQATN